MSENAAWIEGKKYWILGNAKEHLLAAHFQSVSCEVEFHVTQNITQDMH